MDDKRSNLSCPEHGRLAWKHVTTQKSCGLCMEQYKLTPGTAPRLIVVEDEKEE
jgi:hypothetical protein